MPTLILRIPAHQHITILPSGIHLDEQQPAAENEHEYIARLVDIARILRDKQPQPSQLGVQHG